tara:strand:+ start:164 stop:337 length:174 start_codon:yes stop_codon:yes gene_type:complete
MLNNNQGSKNMNKDIIDSVKMLKKYCDIQSKRIDLLEARCRRLEAKEDIETKKGNND